jgi:hypothetical protein
MGRTGVIPAWVKPAPRAVADCHRIGYALAHRADHAAVADTINWVVGCQVAPITGRPSPPTVGDVHTEMAAARRGGARDDAVCNTLAWLVGFGSIPPIPLPRRNPDDTVATADDLFAEYMVGKWDGPEVRRDARHRAEADAALYRRLADVADNA